MRRVPHRKPWRVETRANALHRMRDMRNVFSPQSSDSPVGLFVDRAVESFFRIFRKIFVATYPKSDLELFASGWDAVDAAALGAQRGCRAGWRKARERSNGELTNDVAAYGEVVWS
jgi:hypothetical protein